MGNEEVGKSLPEEEEPIYPDVLAIIPGVVLGSDLEDGNVLCSLSLTTET